MIPVQLTTRKRSTMKVPESGVLRACLDLLMAERIWHERRNTGAMKGSHKGKGWFVRFSKPGTADILASPWACVAKNHFRADVPLIYSPTFLWIECKGSSGRQSPEQKEFECEVERQGHIYLLVNDVDILRDWLKENARNF
jgi:hypothetical protein